MEDKKYTYVYSENAAKEYGANLITLKNGKKFYTTAILQTERYNDDSYHWVDKKVVYECLDSEVLSNKQTEHANLVNNYNMEKDGYPHTNLTACSDKIIEIRKKNKSFINSDKNRYKKLI